MRAEIVDCADYEEWVAADVDGYADPEVQAARRHADECASCGALRGRQVEIRERARSAKLDLDAPIGLRTRILASIAEPEGQRFPWLRPLWAAATAVGVAVLAFALLRDPPDPSLEAFAASFRSEIAISVAFSTPDRTALAEYFADEMGFDSPPIVHDLAGAGFTLVGGSVRRVAGGPARVSIYRDGETKVVCHFVPVATLAELGLEDGEERFVRVNGVSLCITRVGDEICLMATALPIETFLRRLAV